MRILSSIAIALLAMPSLAEQQADYSIERVTVVGSAKQLQEKSGSVARIDELTLEQMEYDDIGRILTQIPGVNVRSEDGYGLRPNIGFRGVTPERSKKINILEDGVLIGPAPYSAPAAYYFPMVSRMTAVEVVKGSGAVKYGPNTVAGTLNLVTRPIPVAAEGGLDVSLGAEGYQKLHGHYGDTVNGFGYLLEWLQLGSDGFKELDGGGETGFDKTDVMAKFGYEWTTSNSDQRLELKISQADEQSNETYLGLADADFSANPYRRYAATQLDNMDWTHRQVMLSHELQTSTINITSRIYRHEFERSWYKLNKFVSSQGGIIPELLDVLLEPTNPEFANYYAVLTGQQDSTVREMLEVGDNAREYVSQGLQFDADLQYQAWQWVNQLEFGLRLHSDYIERNHTADNYLMQQGQLVSTMEPTRATSTNREESDVVSLYVQNTLELGQLNLTVGTRGEYIKGRYQNRAPEREQDWQQKEHLIWLPSVSGYYRINDNMGLFAGVHQGYVPVSPLQDVRIEPELSLNYELGWRYADGSQNAEIAVFYNDFDNLSESCSFSVAASCASNGELDQTVNAGNIQVYGLELHIADDVTLNDNLTLPWSLTYTYTDSKFGQDLNSDFTMWGDIEQGDVAPYLADHVATVAVGLKNRDWQVNVLVNYMGEMLEASGQNVSLSGYRTDDYVMVDVNASYDFNAQHSVYLKLDNLSDVQAIASRRPYGARPVKPQQWFAGYKYRF